MLLHWCRPFEKWEAIACNETTMYNGSFHACSHGVSVRTEAIFRSDIVCKRKLRFGPTDPSVMTWVSASELSAKGDLRTRKWFAKKSFFRLCNVSKFTRHEPPTAWVCSLGKELKSWEYWPTERMMLRTFSAALAFGKHDFNFYWNFMFRQKRTLYGSQPCIGSVCRAKRARCWRGMYAHPWTSGFQNRSSALLSRAKISEFVTSRLSVLARGHVVPSHIHSSDSSHLVEKINWMLGNINFATVHVSSKALKIPLLEGNYDTAFRRFCWLLHCIIQLRGFDNR